jgi:transmembrane sensor
MSQSGAKHESKEERLLDTLFEEAQATSATEIRENLLADGVDPEQVATQMQAMARQLVMKSKEARLRAKDRHEHLAPSAEPVVVDRHDKARARERCLSEEAARWYLSCSNGEMSWRDRAKFLAWLCHAPQNISEVLKIAHLSHQLQRSFPASHRSQIQFAKRASRHSSKHRHSLRWKWGSVVALLVVGIFVGRDYIERGHVVTTGASEWRNLSLDDGSAVHVDARSSIMVKYTAKERIVHVSKGEAVFEVAKDLKRPFIARTDLVDVTAVGTRFAVSIGADVAITVSEGTVRVTRRGQPDGPSRMLKAGESYRVINSNFTSSRVAQVDAERKLQWARNGRLNLGGMTVEEGVEEFNRRNRMQIIVESPTLAARVIASANVPANQPKTYATAVAAESGVEMEVDEKNGIIRLSD